MVSSGSPRRCTAHVRDLRGRLAERQAPFTQKTADVIACVTFSGLTCAELPAMQRAPWRKWMSAERHKTGTAGAPTIDVSALRARYRDERDRRLRAEGKA